MTGNQIPAERLDEAFRLALERFQAGDMGDVLRLCDGLLALVPGHPVVLNLAASARHLLGEHDLALRLLDHAIAAAPAFADAHNTRGVVLRALGRLADAAEAHRAAVQAAPGHLRARLNLAAVLNALGDHDGALAAAQTARETAPDSAEARSLAAVALRHLGRVPDAIALLREALAIDPMLPELHVNLGNALLQTGEPRQAELSFRRALVIDPDDVEALSNLGNVLLTQGQLRDAVECLERALRVAPDHGEVPGNLGVALTRMGRHRAAVAMFRKALAVSPHHPELYFNLGAALQLGRQLDGALAAHCAGLLLGTDDLRLKAASNLLYALQLADLDSARLGAVHRAVGRLFTTPETPARVGADHDRLRIGFLSSDLGRHPVGFFLQGYVRHADRAAVELFAYSTRAAADDITDALRGAMDVWRDCFGWTDDSLDAQIRIDGIDILVDLAGHTAGNHLPLFARRPAPVQASWAGYVGTTGLAAMDWLIADANHLPEGEDQSCTERVVRLPDDYVVYTPPADLPAVGPLPARTTGTVTFGCFNNGAKVSERAIALWARVLATVPDSRLLLKTHGLDDAGVAGELVADFATHGIAPERLILEGGTSHRELLDSYNRVDVALDTLPYSGGLTTCEALWMGVPVVTLPGRSFAGRHSRGHLTAAGLTPWIAADEDGFVAIAAGLAADIDALAHWRTTLRERVAASPLGDAPRFARALDQAFARMWHERNAVAAPAATAPLPPPTQVAIVTTGADALLARDIAHQVHPCLQVEAESFALGARKALAEGADALLFAGPGVRLLPDHVAALIAAEAPIATSPRLLLAADGSSANDRNCDGDAYAAPECILLRGAALEFGRLWETMPADLSAVADRVFWLNLRMSELHRVRVAVAGAAIAQEVAGAERTRAREVAQLLAEGMPARAWLSALVPGLL